MTGSVDCHSALPETQLVVTHLHVDTTWALYVGVSFPYGSSRREARVWHQTALRLHSWFFSRSSQEVFSTRGYFCKTSEVQIRSFSVLGDLPKAIVSHLPVCQLYRWQLAPYNTINIIKHRQPSNSEKVTTRVALHINECRGLLTDRRTLRHTLCTEIETTQPISMKGDNVYTTQPMIRPNDRRDRVTNSVGGNDGTKN